ncbi:hypothetical protein HNQ59_003241 [Chitinivorax tropicus]|uniref:Peptidase C13 n=1 Tax=Chitinivorax tropicus TaxID=714531 RepID=A0A840MUC8_9PROT|nr:C13 family peptidase [Chitinivorax tropicus]MBB5019933.1 hypothetical protein [Chitinivorax tropicus]
MKALWRSFSRNLWAGLRLLMLQPVAVRDFRSRPEQLTLLILTGAVLEILLCQAEFGGEGDINWVTLPNFLSLTMKDLALGMVLAWFFRNRRLLLWWPVLVLSADIWLSVLCWPLVKWAGLRLHSPDLANSSLISGVMMGLMLWYLMTILLALKRTLAISLRSTLLIGAALIPLQFVASTFYDDPLWLPTPAEAQTGAQSWPEPAPPRLLDESFLYNEQARLTAQLSAVEPSREGVVDTYLLAVAGDASQRVFKHEVQAIQQLFDSRFGTRGRSITLVNSQDTAGTLPLATRSSIDTAIQHIAHQMDRHEDMLVLYLTSHGSKQHEFQLSFDPLDLPPVTPDWLKEALDRAGIRWRAIAVSACYSGGFIPPLANDTTLIVTAADAQHPSFGCEDREQFTYFGQAMFNEALRKTDDWQHAFQMAQAAILQREKQEGYDPSNPQISIGRAFSEHWMGALAGRQADSGVMPNK